MDKATYTKGPWRVFTTTDGSKLIGIGELNGDGITDCGFGVWRGGDAEAIANAKLIAAAPDLVEVLRDLTIFYGDDTEAREVLRSDFTGPEPLLMDDDALRESVWNNARAALSKALGEGQEDNG